VSLQYRNFELSGLLATTSARPGQENVYVPVLFLELVQAPILPGAGAVAVDIVLGEGFAQVFGALRV
jgi:hypothetical protein